MLVGGESGKIRFLSTSCIMAAQNVFHTMSELRNLKVHVPDFTLFIGDLIYADVPIWPFGLGSNVKTYYAKYRETFRNQYFLDYVQHSPMFYMYDDHEINNDYTGGK